MKKVLSIVLLSLVLSFSVAVAQQSVSFESVTNTLNDTTLEAGNTHVISMRIINSSANFYNPGNGFEISSPDGATWTTVVGAWVNNYEANYTQAFINAFSDDGALADTIGFAGVSFGFPPALGLPAGFDGVAMTITIGPTFVADAGKHICIDSSFYPPGGTWKWADLVAVNPQITPDWSDEMCWRIDVASAVGDVGGNLPTEFALAQNYPNPFNPTTKINFDVPRHAHVTLKIFNILGQEVETLVNEDMVAGRHFANWDASNYGSGIYFYRIEADSFVKTNKMMLLK